MPPVSAIIPAYRAAAFIGSAIECVLAQRHVAVEAIVVNDGSPDTAALAAALEPWRGEARVRYLERPNGGPSAARNTGLGAARADIVAFLDADDTWTPDYLATQLHVLQSRELDLVYCDALLTGQTPLAGRRYMETTPSAGEVTLEALIRLTCNIPTSCVVARKAPLLEAGGFDEQLRRCEDYDLWMRLAAAGARLGYHRAVLARHHAHDESAAADQVAMFTSQREVYLKLRGLLGPDHPAAPTAADAQARAEADLALELAKAHLRDGRYAESARSLARARQYYRRPRLALAALAVATMPSLVRRAMASRDLAMRTHR